MTVLSPHATRADLVRNIAVALLAIVQVVVAVVAGDAVGPVAREYATPLLAAGWTFAVWLPIYAGFLGYAAYQALPGQRARQVHRRTGWWLAASAVFNAAWVLAFGAGWLPLAELLILALLVCVAVAYGRFTRTPADGVLERVLVRGTVALYTGWVSLATALGTAATGVWIGLPGAGPLAVIAAIVVLLAVTAVVSWAVLAGTAVVPLAAAVVWAIAGTALNDPPAGVVVAGAVAIVVVIASVVRRITTAGFPVRAAWG
ncbi:tryptophan-rich sensory protein [Pseudonocardia kunmingensis]|uniref:TspO/MBR related protein n=1 Tax=Pseudonocardia kunmingensis TaxID=630975 RepID=A0A543DJP5_9PSEU|nr:tryptophan-rich sensory protein [Pseudonocardia kunmingensis]TQM09560.1 TspO/MBR related protein [Pseudonocardia kunmingensis]